MSPANLVKFLESIDAKGNPDGFAYTKLDYVDQYLNAWKMALTTTFEFRRAISKVHQPLTPAIHGWIPLRADAFEKLYKIGQGTYSSVFRVREIETRNIVAREIMILKRQDHLNIIKLDTSHSWLDSPPRRCLQKT